MTEQNLPSSKSQPSELPDMSTGNASIPKLPALVTKQSSSPLRRIPAWRFWAPLLIQFALLVVVPFKSAMTYATGQTVTLKTAPVDPYDMLRGYSQTLRFDISNVDTLRSLPGGSEVFKSSNEATPFYVTLEAPKANAAATVPEAWKPIKVSAEYPEDLAANQIALKGEETYGWVTYGLETYYMPESQRNDINDRISQIQRSGDETFVVNVKIDDSGGSVPESLWVGDREYRF